MFENIIPEQNLHQTNNFTLMEWGGDNKKQSHELLLLGAHSCLLCSLGDLASSSFGLVNRLDNSYGNSLSHVTNGESSKRGIVGEGLNAEGFCGD